MELLYKTQSHIIYTKTPFLLLFLCSFSLYFKKNPDKKKATLVGI
jgi:hypothetical protein